MVEDFEQAIARIEEFKRAGGPVAEAHAHSSRHRAEIESSANVGCFYCCEIYLPALIEEWIDEGDTALCPRCGIDSVIGEASGFPVTDTTFLKAMNKAWF